MNYFTRSLNHCAPSTTVGAVNLKPCVYWNRDRRCVSLRIDSGRPTTDDDSTCPNLLAKIRHGQTVRENHIDSSIAFPISRNDFHDWIFHTDVFSIPCSSTSNMKPVLSIHFSKYFPVKTTCLMLVKIFKCVVLMYYIRTGDCGWTICQV